MTVQMSSRWIAHLGQDRVVSREEFHAGTQSCRRWANGSKKGSARGATNP